jgi:hypothetical protein
MKYMKQFDAVIVLGCESATETVRNLVKSTHCRVIEGMEVVGVMNARPRLHSSGHISFEDCEIIPLPQPPSQAEMSVRVDRSIAHTQVKISRGNPVTKQVDSKMGTQ